MTPELLRRRGVLVGVVHLPALPGAPRYAGSMNAVVHGAERDAHALASAGFDAVIVENFGDAPFHRGACPAETIAAMAVCAERVRRVAGLPLGVNVLRNDGDGAMAVAAATEACFVRVNVLVGARVTDQGVIESCAATMLRTRARLQARGVGVVADVDVKHSSPLGSPRLAEEAREAVERALADVLVVTGAGTGREASEATARAVRAAAPETPLWVGSGVRPGTLPAWLSRCDGVIVGSALREGDRAGGPVVPARARAFAEAFREAERSRSAP
ncbi:MAG: BtpA/SgcQ family protein [Deltaproteobacteria bacterium]|nr:BtpA/SgcQ family protein [Deltaproteobacteria bacterium]